MNIHEKYIKRCIELAKNGIGLTYPNPLVGCVIVFNNKIIGEGWHKKAGGPHAEVFAINSVKDKAILKHATIYVSLEPCSHFGKTPPCTNLIIENGIKNVVIGIIDSNSLVSGKGVQHLKNNGCNVTVGVLENECYNLNKRFFTFHQKKRPYIFLKWAETTDGFIDRIRDKNSAKQPNWISNKLSQQLVHKMRSEEQAVLIGTTTALNDNPALTVRSWFGENPIRIVLDRELKIPITNKVFNKDAITIVLTEKTYFNELPNIKYSQIDFSKNIPSQICSLLYVFEIQSVIIEGGAKTLQAFIEENLWDEAFVFIGNTKFSKGLKAPKLNCKPSFIKNCSTDTLKIYTNT